MRPHLARNPKHLTATLITLLVTIGALLNTTGVLAGAGTACGCALGNQGNLKFKQAGILTIPVGATNTFTVEYTETSGPSGLLTRKIESGPFTTPGGTCGTPLNELTNKQTCTIEIKCTGSAGQRGKAAVTSNEVLVNDARETVECT
jgi:hypothetical protein